MFAGLDAGLGSPIPPMGANPAQPGAAAPGMAPEAAGGSRKYFIVGFLVLLLIGIVVGGYFAYGKFSAMVNKDEEQPAVVETPVETGNSDMAATTTAPSPAAATSGEVADATTTPASATSSPLGTETAAATSSATSTVALPAVDRTKDSDSDGLTDYEEESFYKSNPSVADTDGDGFSDGAEVKNGFNPLGAGKMIDSQINPPVTQ